MPATALKAQLEEIGVAGSATLYVTATEALRNAKLSPFQAQKAFHKAISANARLQSELELNFLRSVAEDMQNGSDAVVGQTGTDIQLGCAHLNSSDSEFKIEPIRHSEPVVVSEHYRRAAQKAARMTATTILDSFRIRDGRSIGDVQWYELGYLIADNVREAAVLKAVKGMFATVSNDQAKVRDLVRPKELERIVQKAAEIEDAMRNRGGQA